MRDDGERQVAPTLDGIRRDHVARYEFAARMLPRGAAVIDLACGVGYGSAVLADAGFKVAGIDRSGEAIAYGRQHYARSRVELIQLAAEQLGECAIQGFRAAVCFEAIEHLADPLPVLKTLCRAAPLLIASVPNEAVFPFRCPANDHRGWRHHYRHYTRDEFAGLLEAAGYEVTGWFGQQGPESEVEKECEGRTLIMTAVRAGEASKAADAAAEKAPAPEHVAILGLGPSVAAYLDLIKRLGSRRAYADEVWGINALGDVLACDRVFHMDDMKVQEARAAARPDGNIAAMVAALKTHPGPVYTSVVRDGYPGFVPFPLAEVLSGRYDCNGTPYFNNTAAYAIALAIHIGVKRISLFGIDFTHPNIHSGEQGRACCEFWLGIAAGRGIEITVPEQTTLLDACAPERELLYGYDCVDVEIEHGADGVAVRMVERAGEVDAAEIERRYDHGRHPNRLMAAE